MGRPGGRPDQIACTRWRSSASWSSATTAVLRGQAAAHDLGDAIQRGVVEEQGDVQLHPELGPDPCHQVDGTERVAAELEEVLALADVVRPERRGPQPAQPLRYVVGSSGA